MSQRGVASRTGSGSGSGGGGDRNWEKSSQFQAKSPKSAIKKKSGQLPKAV